MWLERIYLRFPLWSTYHKFSCSLCSNNQVELVINKLSILKCVFQAHAHDFEWKPIMFSHLLLASSAVECQGPLVYGVYIWEQRFTGELFFLANAFVNIHWHPSVDSFFLGRSSFVSSRYFEKILLYIRGF